MVRGPGSEYSYLDQSRCDHEVYRGPGSEYLHLE